MKMLYCVSVIISIFLLISCGVTDNENNDQTISKPGRRDYVWQTDIVYGQNSQIYSMWGSSSDNVWIVGYSTYVFIPQVWHFNGSNWDWCSNTPNDMYANCIFGIDESNIWIGDDKGGIYFYNGSTWVKDFQYNDANLEFLKFNKLWGSTRSNLYAVGTASVKDSFNVYRSVVLHYNGASWEELFKGKTSLQYFNIIKYKSNLYLAGYLRDSDDKNYYVIDEYKNGSINEIYKAESNIIGRVNIELIGGELYFMIGKSLMKYNESGLTEFLRVENVNYDYYACGRNENDIFFIMTDGIMHYNGTDIQYIYNLPTNGSNISGKVSLFKNDIFIVGSRYALGYEISQVLHGSFSNYAK